MERTIELPKRADNHIRETTGNKVLESLIPAEWIIRSVSERDYGVDCYIELVDEENHLTGEIAFVQMKATDKIDWRIRDNGFKFYKVDRVPPPTISAVSRYPPIFFWLTSPPRNCSSCQSRSMWRSITGNTPPQAHLPTSSLTTTIYSL